MNTGAVRDRAFIARIVYTKQMRVSASTTDNRPEVVRIAESACNKVAHQLRPQRLRANWDVLPGNIALAIKRARANDGDDIAMDFRRAGAVAYRGLTILTRGSQMRGGRFTTSRERTFYCDGG
jgi:hypothetical protein